MNKQAYLDGYSSPGFAKIAANSGEIKSVWPQQQQQQPQPVQPGSRAFDRPAPASFSGAKRPQSFSGASTTSNAKRPQSFTAKKAQIDALEMGTEVGAEADRPVSFLGDKAQTGFKSDAWRTAKLTDAAPFGSTREKGYGFA